ncbi:MAG: hypothetical protein Q4F84_03835 [Fibrobacter sp.]|nr:hypothetical protein [Fibrobacter sp.]
MINSSPRIAGSSEDEPQNLAALLGNQLPRRLVRSAYRHCLFVNRKAQTDTFKLNKIALRFFNYEL